MFDKTDITKGVKGNKKTITAIATFYLLLMSQQYVWLEGELVSPLKVAALYAAPMFFLFLVPRISKAVLWGGVYLVWLFATMYLRFDSPRFETLGYRTLFFMMFMMFYNMVYAGAFSKEYFQKLMCYWLWAYIISIIIQQMWSLTVGGELYLINYYYVSSGGELKVPGLSLEPSHSARIMAIAFYAFLKVTELINEDPVTLKYLFSKYRNLFIGFLYAMIAMQSGTAIFMLAILSLYFLTKKQMIYVLPIFIVVVIMLPHIEYEPLQRTLETSEATLTGDVDEIKEVDHSASARIVPILNALKMNFSDIDTWLGHGTDAAKAEGHLSEVHTIWTDKGVVCYFLGAIFIFACMIYPITSLPLLFAILLGFPSLGNVYLGWSNLMILTCVSYFIRQDELTGKINDEKNITNTPSLF